MCNQVLLTLEFLFTMTASKIWLEVFGQVHLELVRPFGYHTNLMV